MAIPKSIVVNWFRIQMWFPNVYMEQYDLIWSNGSNIRALMSLSTYVVSTSMEHSIALEK